MKISSEMYFVKVACVYFQFVLMLPRLNVSFSVFTSLLYFFVCV